MNLAKADRRDAVSITLPVRTVSESNRREHWAVRAGRVKAHRGIVGLALRAMLVTYRIGDGLNVMLTHIAPRELDDDNLLAALKAARDGVSDALGIDDRDPRATWLYGQRRGGAGQYAIQVDVWRR